MTLSRHRNAALYALSMLHTNDGMYGIKIRKLHPNDARIMATIFFDAVHEGTKDHYTEAQRRAWGGSAPIPERWRHTIGDMIGFIAEENGQPLGFMTIDAEGFIDLAFVSPSVSGRGVGYQLYNAVEEKAHDLGAPVLSTVASKAQNHSSKDRAGSSLKNKLSSSRAGCL